MYKHFIRVIAPSLLLMLAMTNTAQGLANIAEIRKMQVSDTEYPVKRVALAVYTGYWGKTVSEREALTIKRFKQENERTPGDPVMVDFDAIGNHLSDTVLEAYNRLAQQDQHAAKLTPGKEKLLRDKIRHFLVIGYVKQLTKSYIGMKENKSVVDYCDKVETSQIRSAFICMSGKHASRRQYTLYLPYHAQQGRKNNEFFSFSFQRQSKTWLLNQINLNPDLMTDKFFLFLAYLK